MPSARQQPMTETEAGCVRCAAPRGDRWPSCSFCGALLARVSPEREAERRAQARRCEDILESKADRYHPDVVRIVACVLVPGAAVTVLGRLWLSPGQVAVLALMSFLAVTITFLWAVGVYRGRALRDTFREELAPQLGLGAEDVVTREEVALIAQADDLPLLLEALRA